MGGIKGAACEICAVPVVVNDSGEKTPQQRGGK